MFRKVSMEDEATNLPLEGVVELDRVLKDDEVSVLAKVAVVEDGEGALLLELMYIAELETT